MQAKKFRDLGGEGKWRDWEVVLAGDFNTQPNELAYSLLTSHSITAPQIEALEISTVVHMSVDKIYDPTFRSIPSPEEAEGGKHTDPDKVIKNARQGTDSDGLLDLEGFKALYDYSLCKAGACSCSLTGPSTTIPDSRNEVTSAYGSISHLLPAFDLNMYVDRTPEVHSTSGWNIPEKAEVVKARREAACLRKGDYEPKWTNCEFDHGIHFIPDSKTDSESIVEVTPLWRCTLECVRFHLLSLSFDHVLISSFVFEQLYIPAASISPSHLDTASFEVHWIIGCVVVVRSISDFLARADSISVLKLVQRCIRPSKWEEDCRRSLSELQIMRV